MIRDIMQVLITIDGMIRDMQVITSIGGMIRDMQVLIAIGGMIRDIMQVITSIAFNCTLSTRNSDFRILCLYISGQLLVQGVRIIRVM